MSINKFWNDERALEFAQVCSMGAYGEYKGCKSREDKLEKYKELKNSEDKVREAHAIAHFADSFGLLCTKHDIRRFNEWMAENNYDNLLEP